jgi:hypothetical protein
MAPKTLDARRCKARSSRSGKPCQQWAIHGGTVCQAHGGRAPQVKRKAAERLADLIDPDRALREAARLAYSDVRELFDERGGLKPVKDWPDDLAAAVASVEVVKRNVDSGDGKIDDVIKLRMWDKPKNIELLFKHLGLLVEKVEHSGGVTVKWEGE